MFITVSRQYPTGLKTVERFRHIVYHFITGVSHWDGDGQTLPCSCLSWYHVGMPLRWRWSNASVLLFIPVSRGNPTEKEMVKRFRVTVYHCSTGGIPLRWTWSNASVLLFITESRESHTEMEKVNCSFVSVYHGITEVYYWDGDGQLLLCQCLSLYHAGIILWRLPIISVFVVITA